MMPVPTCDQNDASFSLDRFESYLEPFAVRVVSDPFKKTWCALLRSRIEQSRMSTKSQFLLMKNPYESILLSFLLILSCNIIFAQLEECEVCTDVFTEVMQRVDASGESASQEVVRQNLVDYCNAIVGKDDKKEKLCFFIGAHKDSATSVLGDISKPLSYRKPPIKVCQELKEKDSQICDLKYDKPIDWDSLELDKMRVKQLKELLAKLGDSCKGCTEKIDFVNRIRELMPKPKEEL